MQHRAPVGADGPVKVQAVGPAVQGHVGLVIPDGGVQPGNIPGGDIGGIADDAVKVPQPLERRAQGVQLHGCHPAGKAAAADVLAADPQSPVAELPQHHPGVLHLAGDGQAQAAGTGAQVQDPGGLLLPQPADGGLGQGLRVGPGDQHAFADVQGQAVKLPLADEISHRLPGQTPAGQRPGRLLHLRGRVQRAVPQQPGLILSGGEAHQLPGLQGGGLDPRLPQGPPDIQGQIVVCNSHYQASFPCSSGSTSFRASMATSSMESSGSLVVKF